jgi:23S rRNA pseudouridine2605 synthase
VLHKPRGVLTTLADPEGRPTVRDLLAGVRERVFPVGRLDVNTTGLLLLTTDGALALGLTHPRRGVERVYRVKVHGPVDAAQLARLRRGIRLTDGFVQPTYARVVRQLPTKTWLDVGVTEGRKHVVRRLMEAVGHPVDKLERVALGPLRLGRLALGAWRDVTADELAALHAAAGISLPPAVPRISPPPAAARPRAAAPASAPRARDTRPRTPPSRPGRPRPPAARGARADAPGARPRSRGPGPRRRGA